MRRSSGGICQAVLLATAAASPAPASAYRPFDATDAAVAPRGAVEIELGVGYLSNGQDRALAAPTLVLNWGFAGRWEAVIEARHVVELSGDLGGAPRVEGAALSVKGVLREGSLQEKAGPSVAAEVGALIPSHDQSGVGAEGALVVSQRWTDLTVHLNGAAAWTRAHAPAAFCGVILEGHDAWAVRPVAEVFVERERGAPATSSALVGTIWRVTEALSVDAAARLARADGLTATELRIGVTWGFGVGFPR